jgi:hypothetical protein
MRQMVSPCRQHTSVPTNHVLSSTSSSAPDLLTEEPGRLSKQASPEAAGLKEISKLWDHLLQLNGECAVRTQCNAPKFHFQN